MAKLVYPADQRNRAIRERQDAGEDVSVTELLDALRQQGQVLRDAVVKLGLEIDKLRQRARAAQRGGVE